LVKVAAKMDGDFVNQVNAVEVNTICRVSTVRILTDRLLPHLFMSSPQRRIEDRIRELCAKAKTATNGDLEPILQELSQLLRETIEHMRKSATSLFVEGKPLLEPRRRANDNEV